MGEWSPWHWAIVAVVVLVLFGSRRLPDAARSLGRSLRIFKTEMNALHDDDPQHAGELHPAAAVEQSPGHDTPPSASAGSTDATDAAPRTDA